MQTLSRLARLYVLVVVALALAVLLRAPWAWHSPHALPAAVYAAAAMLGARLKVRLPGMTGTLSVSFVFVLLAVLELDLAEVLAVALLGITAQVYWAARERPSAVQVIFNLAAATLAAGSAYAVFHSLALARWATAWLGLLLLAALVYFLVNALAVALILSLTEGRALAPLLRKGFVWVAPEFLVGAFLAGACHAAGQRFGWPLTVLALPAAYGIFRSYQLYIGRLEEENRRARDLAGMHWRTIEALALAIDAKDNTTHEHLTRVQIYATGLARELALPEEQFQAVQIAALLHDIGKLAVPEMILNKPGKLSPEEFEALKVHPLVSAEILERVAFPFPVVPIVRAHHERWDGCGYPAGLRGEQIPIGARILAAVDCLDALASDRQYHSALPLAEAMEKIRGEAGRAFDPAVVEALERRYVELEAGARSTLGQSTRLTRANPQGLGGQPAAGYEVALNAGSEADDAAVAAALAALRQELETLVELSGEFGRLLALPETLALLLAPLARALPHRTLAVYLERQGTLVPEYVAGEESHLYSELRMPLGRGISGWVARHGRRIINGDPALEFGPGSHSRRGTRMRSVLAVPLEGPSGVMGTVAWYHDTPDHFSASDARLVLGSVPQIGLALALAREAGAARPRGDTDEVTGLPGSRQLFLCLEREVGRCRREQHGLTVLVFGVERMRDLRQRLGEPFRNRVLCTIARALQTDCRDYDYVARTGGDGFASVLPGSWPDGGLRRGLDLAASAAGALRMAGVEEPLALDVGHADFPADGETAEQLLAEAERRLCRAIQARLAARS